MKKRGFGSKIFISATSSFTLSALVLSLVFFNISEMTRIQKEIAKSQMIISDFSRIVSYMVDLETGERGYMLTGDLTYLEPFSKAEEVFDKYAQEVHSSLAAYPSQIERIEKINKIKKEWSEGPVIAEMMARRKATAGMMTQQEFIDLLKSSEGKSMVESVRNIGAEAIQEEEKKLVELNIINESKAKWVVAWAALGLLSVLLGFSVVVITARRVVQHMTLRTETLKKIVIHLNDTAHHVSHVSQVLSDSNQKQSASLESTASSIEEMNSMVSNNAENAGVVQQTASASEDVANKGRESVVKVISTIGEIDQNNQNVVQSIEENNNQLKEIMNVIREIESKTKVINDIVFQTRLLSFNASVEAARAGEHGKGFAVVAEEVGNLAQMSGAASTEISGLLEKSLQRVDAIILETRGKMDHLIDASRAKVEVGTVVAKECGEVLEKVVQNVTQVSSLTKQITTATQEQAQGIAQVSRAMNELSQITDKNRSTSHEAQESSDKLLKQARELSRIVQDIVIEIQGEALAQQNEGTSTSSPHPSKDAA